MPRNRKHSRGLARRNTASRTTETSALTRVDQRIKSQHELAATLVGILNNRLNLSVRILLFFIMWVASVWFILRDLITPPECGSERIDLFSTSAILKQLLFYGSFYFVVKALEHLFWNNMRRTPHFDILLKIFNGELDDTVISQQQLDQLTETLNEIQLRETQYASRYQQFHIKLIFIIKLAVYVCDFPFIYLIYLILPSLTNLLLKNIYNGAYSVDSFLKLSVVNPDDLHQKLQQITGKGSWSLRTHNRATAFSYLGRSSEIEKKLLIAFLKHSGFNILEKDRTLSVTRTTTYSESDFLSSQILYKNRSIAFAKCLATKEIFQQQCRSMYRTWKFEFFEKDKMPILISTISFVNESIASKWFETLSPLFNDNIDRQFSTIIVKGDPSDEKLLATSLATLVRDTNSSALAALPPAIAVSSKDEADDFLPPAAKAQHEKVKTRGRAWAMVKDLFHKPTPTITWKVVTQHGFVNINYNSATQFGDQNPAVQQLFSREKTDYYAILDTSDIPREFLEYAQRGFAAGYRPNKSGKKPGNCISDGSRVKDGCEFKIRMSKRARIKHYTSDTNHNGRIARLCYFSIFDKNSHDAHRRVQIDAGAGTTSDPTSPQI